MTTTEKTVTVALKRTYGYRGQMYGPGAEVEVPVGLAEGLGLTGNQEPVAPAPAPEPETGDTAPDSPAPRVSATKTTGKRK